MGSAARGALIERLICWSVLRAAKSTFASCLELHALVESENRQKRRIEFHLEASAPQLRAGTISGAIYLLSVRCVSPRAVVYANLEWSRTEKGSFSVGKTTPLMTS